MDKLLKARFLPRVNSIRTISSSPTSYSRLNFRKFILPNRGSEAFRKMQEENPHPDIFPIRFGVRKTKYDIKGKRTEIPELLPEIIVPDLTDCKFQPYVSYRATDVVQSEFTSQDLFNAIYRKKIVKDFKENKLDENDNSLEPSDAELLSAEEAKTLAEKTGSDLFAERAKQD